MASGRLAASAPPADTDTRLYQAPAGTLATVSVCCANRSGSDARVRVALADSTASAPSIADFVEYDAALAPNVPLERTGLVVGPGQQIFVRADAPDVSFVAYGIEGAA